MICTGLTSFIICKTLILNFTNFCETTTDPMFCIRHAQECAQEVITGSINPNDKARADSAYRVCTDQVLKVID